jgi:hypothetical protein
MGSEWYLRGTQPEKGKCTTSDIQSGMLEDTHADHECGCFKGLLLRHFHRS